MKGLSMARTKKQESPQIPVTVPEPIDDGSADIDYRDECFDSKELDIDLDALYKEFPLPEGYIYNEHGWLMQIIEGKPKKSAGKDGFADVERGSTFKEIMTSYVPIIIETQAINTRHETFFQLKWRQKGKIYRLWVSAHDARSATGMTANMDKIPINSTNNSAIVKYLALYENTMDINTETWVEKIGWNRVGYQSVFAFQDEILGMENVYFNRLYQQDNDNRFIVAGNLEPVRELVGLIKPYPHVIFPFLVSLATPFIELLQQESFVIHMASETSSGKTTAMRIAESVWGNPNDLKFTWHATDNGFEQLAKSFKNLPILVDESSIRNGEYGKDFIERVVYLFANGRGKTRSNRAGTGMRDVGSWRTVMFSTGECSLKATMQKSGVNVRVLEISDLPWGEKSDEIGQIIKQVEKIMMSNYGHLGREAIRRILTDEFQLKAVLTWRQQFLAELNPESSEETRLAAHAFIGYLGGMLLEDIFPGCLSRDELMTIIQTNFKCFRESLNAMETLDEIVLGALFQFVQKDVSYSWDDPYSSCHLEHDSKIKDGYLYLSVDGMDEFLKQSRFQEKEVKGILLRHGFLHTEKNGKKLRYKVRLTINNRKGWFYKIDMNKLHQYCEELAPEYSDKMLHTPFYKAPDFRIKPRFDKFDIFGNLLKHKDSEQLELDFDLPTQRAV